MRPPLATDARMKMLRGTLGAWCWPPHWEQRWRWHCWSAAVRRFRPGIPLLARRPAPSKTGLPRRSNRNSCGRAWRSLRGQRRGRWRMTGPTCSNSTTTPATPDSDCSLRAPLTARPCWRTSTNLRLTTWPASFAAISRSHSVRISAGRSTSRRRRIPVLLYAGDGAEWTAGAHAYLRIGVVPAAGDAVFVVVIEVGEDAPAGTLEIADLALQHASVRDGRPLLCCALVR